ncbi:hypothetical protein E2320_002170 [Naja naja]|nr:hypothetical protein E2320_002170 [Naja naja]
MHNHSSRIPADGSVGYIIGKADSTLCPATFMQGGKSFTRGTKQREVLDEAITTEQSGRSTEKNTNVENKQPMSCQAGCHGSLRGNQGH